MPSIPMTRKKSRHQKDANNTVIQLDEYRQTAHQIDPGRAAIIARWHLDQGANFAGTAALLNISIGPDGAPRVTAIGIEAEHAVAMLSAIDGVANKLAQTAGNPLLYVNRTLASNGLMQAISRGR
jgi:hypothetical protein